MAAWWETLPRRWKTEETALTATGWDWSIDDSLTVHGVRGVVVRYPVDEPYRHLVQPAPGSGPDDPGAGWVRLLVLYPAAYPFFPPSVRDIDARLDLPWHLEPHARQLCLVNAADWTITTTAAELLTTQLPRMLAAATATDPPPPGWEVPAGEPIGLYVPDHAGARVLVDTTWNIPPGPARGVLEVGFTRHDNGTLGSGAVRRLQADGHLLQSFPSRLLQQFPITAPGRWLRWDGFEPTMTAAQVWRQTEPLLEPLRSEQTHDGTPAHVEPAVEVIGILVPSEVAYRTPGQEWLFAVRHHDHPAQNPAEQAVENADQRPGHDTSGTATDSDPAEGWRYTLYRSAAAGAEDVRLRSPGTAALADRSVLLVGTGAIGGTVAVELARAGVRRLDLLDGDVCDPATACRQHAPVVYAGYSKAAVLRQQLAETNPHVSVHAHHVQLGQVAVAPGKQSNPHDHLAHLTGEADLVIDAAANPAVSRYLAVLAGVLDTTFLHVSATAGGHGGIVATFPPKRPGCWWCMHYHRRDHTLPFPPAADAEDATVAPVGCAEPTFTGTSADLATIATHATRVAIDRLTTNPLAGQRLRGDLYVAALRDHHGRPIPVRWRSRPIRLHPDCPVHTMHGTPPPPSVDAPPPGATDTGSRPATSTDGAPESAGGGECAVTAQAGAGRTVTDVGGAPERKAPSTRTLTTPQRQQHDRTGDSARRGGAEPEIRPDRR